MTWTPEIIIGGIAAVGIGGLLTEVFRWVATGRSQKINDASKLTDMAKSVVESYDQLVADLREQLETQQKQIEGLQTKQSQDRIDIRTLQEKNERLTKQFEALHNDYQQLSEKYQMRQEGLPRCPKDKEE